MSGWRASPWLRGTAATLSALLVVVILITSLLTEGSSINREASASTTLLCPGGIAPHWIGRRRVCHNGLPPVTLVHHPTVAAANAAEVTQLTALTQRAYQMLRTASLRRGPQGLRGLAGPAGSRGPVAP